MKAKHQRLTLVGLAIVGVGGSALLAMSGLKDQAAFFYAPEDVARGEAPVGRAARLGGMVKPGSLTRGVDGISIRFTVADARAQVPVMYSGITPDLFAEGSGVVAEGRFRADGSFAADNLLAKHDERYMPPQATAMPAPAGTTRRTDTLR